MGKPVFRVGVFSVQVCERQDQSRQAKSLPHVAYASSLRLPTTAQCKRHQASAKNRNRVLSKVPAVCWTLLHARKSVARAASLRVVKYSKAGSPRNVRFQSMPTPVAYRSYS